MTTYSRFGADINSSRCVSADGELVSFSQSGVIVTKSTRSADTVFVFENGSESVHDKIEIQLSGDNEKMAVLDRARNSIKVVDLETRKLSMIRHTKIEEIDSLEWLEISGRYDNQHILAVYSSHGLSVKLYAAQEDELVHVHTIYKYASKIIRHPTIENHHTILLRNGIKNTVFSFAVVSNRINEICQFELKDNFSDLVLRFSPLNSWMLFYSPSSSELDISVYNFLGLGKTLLDKSQIIRPGYAFQRLQCAIGFSLGATKVEWAVNTANNEECILCGDHNENLALITLRGQLKIEKVLKHKPLLRNFNYLVFEQNSHNERYCKKSSKLFKLPVVKSDLALQDMGISIVKAYENSRYFAVVTKSMPTVMFLWDFAKLDEPIAVVNTQSVITSVEIGSARSTKTGTKFVDNVIDNLIMISHGNAITFYCPESMSLPLYVNPGFDDRISGAVLHEVSCVDGEIVVRFSCWSKGEVCIASQSISSTEEDEDQVPDPVILTSPQVGLEDTDTNVRHLINGVRQQEWLHTSRVSMEAGGDTFMNKKRKLTSADGKENVYGV